MLEPHPVPVPRRVVVQFVAEVFEIPTRALTAPTMGLKNPAAYGLARAAACYLIREACGANQDRMAEAIGYGNRASCSDALKRAERYLHRPFFATRLDEVRACIRQWRDARLEPAPVVVATIDEIAAAVQALRRARGLSGEALNVAVETVETFLSEIITGRDAVSMGNGE